MEWPPTLVKQKQLRSQEASVGFAKAIFQSAEVPLSVLDQAIGDLEDQGIPITRRGALKKAVNVVMRERDARYSRDLITTDELARVLRESPGLPKESYLNRVEGILRIVTRNFDRWTDGKNGS